LDFSALSKFLPSAQSPRFTELAKSKPIREQNNQSVEDISRLLAELDDTQLATALSEMVKYELSQILRIAPDKIDLSQSIYDMGLDSLMGVEFVVALEGRFGVRLSVMAISENPSIDKLTHLLLEILRTQDNASGETELTPAPHSSSPSKESDYTAQITELVKQHGSDSSAEDIAALAESLEVQPRQRGRFLQ
jgi:acyl carrier protein